jgi:hypothetical protein
MSQSGFTPIQLYRTATPSAAPSAGNLADGELAINTADGKLFYKDSGGVVQTIASKATGTAGGSNTQVQFNSSGALAGSADLTFNGTTLTANTLALTNQLTVGNGGTGGTSFTANNVLLGNGTSAFQVVAPGTNGNVLTSNGTTWTSAAPSGITTGKSIAMAMIFGF